MTTVKQFSELSAEEIKELEKSAKLRAQKNNRDLLENVRCVKPVHDNRTETEKVRDFWVNFKPKIGLEWVIASRKAIREKWKNGG